MSLNSDLQTLKTNIEGVKSTLYTNLTNKGVTDITESDTLTTLANKVSTITAGGSGIDFSTIGYNTELSSEINSVWNNDVAYSKTLYDAWNASNTSTYLLYKDDTKLVYAPNIDTSNVTDMSNMFYGCTNLQVVPKYNTSNVTSMSQMFINCYNLISVKKFDTSNVTNMNYMFNGCKSLTTIPYFDTSQATNMNSMFSSCSNLTSVPLFNTINVTNMHSMFSNCSNLTSVPLFNTINVTNMYDMFFYCESLQTVPAFNTSNVTNISEMFYNCTSLTSVPELDTSKATNFNSIFQDCNSLTTIEGISFKSFSDSTMRYDYLVGWSENSSIRKAVFKDIGYQSTAVQFNTSYITNWGVNTSEIPDARQSLIDSLITYSFDRATAGYPTCTITLSDNTKALLTSDEISQINAKGFTIA